MINFSLPTYNCTSSRVKGIGSLHQGNGGYTGVYSKIELLRGSVFELQLSTERGHSNMVSTLALWSNSRWVGVGEEEGFKSNGFRLMGVLRWARNLFRSYQEL